MDDRNRRDRDRFSAAEGFRVYGGADGRAHMVGGGDMDPRAELEADPGDLGVGNQGVYGAAESERGEGEWFVPTRNGRRPDDAIRDELAGALTDHPRIDASEVVIEVDDGEILLAGAVHDRRVKRLIEDIAEGIPGVTGVDNQLRVVRRS